MASNYYPYVYLAPINPCETLAFRNIPDNRVREFCKTFESVIHKDSPGQSFGFTPEFLEMLCIDMDYVVVALGGNRSHSMDALMSVGNYDAVTRKFSNHRWIMVELKLNSKVAQDDRDDLKLKVDGTLSHIERATIDPVKIFVYPDVCVAVKKSKFQMWKKGSGKQIYKDWKCFSVKDLEEFILLAANIPYNPVNSVEDIVGSFPDDSDIDGVDNQFKYWRRLADDYAVRGNRQEYEHILGALAQYFKNLRERLGDTDDRDLLSLEFDWDFLEKFLQSENE